MSFVDPLWEFVLEDYEDEGTSRREFFRRRRNDREEDFGESWNLDWFDDRNDVSNGKKKVNSSSRKKTDAKSHAGSWGLMPDLGGSKNGKQKSRTEYRDDEADGFWDVISGAPPAATLPKRSTKNPVQMIGSKGRGFLPKKSSPETSRNQTLIRSQSKGSVSSSNKSESNNSDKKKNAFKSRFKWNQNSNASEASPMKGYSIQDLEVKHTNLAKDREDTKTSAFDPMDLIYQIADSLDPWMPDPSEVSTSEVDSYDEIGSNDEDEVEENLIMHGRAVDESRFPESPGVRSSRNKKASSNLESLLDQQLPNPTTFDPSRYPYHSNQSTKETSDCSTEIRLRVNPVGNTLSEEVYNTHTNLEENSGQVREPQNLEERHPRYTSSLDAANGLKSSHIFEDVSEQSDSAGREIKSKVNNEGGRCSLKDMRIPKDVHIRKTAGSCICDDDGDEVGNSRRRSMLKKAVCSMKKNSKNDAINRLKRSDAAEIFPSSRVIIDGETHMIIGPESDPINGAIGVSSSSLIESRGPQSVLAYEYDSNINMDVSCDTPNQNPRTSLSVRKLGAPPHLSSSSGAENIVVQVEASLVSETDCIIRQGLWWGDSRPSFPNTPGIDVVGKVYCTKQTTEKNYGLRPMQTVISLIKWGGNARFLTMHPKQLVKVPRGLDPAEAACLPECYLSAFQVLHMGQNGNLRYRENSLKGKSILILGCMTNNMGKALIELALHSGVANIYATAKKKHWKTLVSYGVMPLSPNPMEWIQRIAGTMDLVLAPNGNLREDVCPVHFRALLPRYGQLIICGHRIVGNDIPIDVWKRDNQLPTLACGKNKALQKILRNSLSYDVYEEWERNLDLCKRDLSHLLKLLERNSIKPEVLDRIPLNKVAKAHELLETKRLPGFLVCEPWMKSKKRAVYL